MQSRISDAATILAEAMHPLLEECPAISIADPHSRLACVGHEPATDQHPPEGDCMSVSGRLWARAGILTMAGVCLLVATPASAATSSSIGSGRLVPTIAAAVGLTGAILGGLALTRSAGSIATDNRRRWAAAAGIAGLISVVVGALHSANSAGGFGTGNGLAGAIVAIAVGLISMVLGGLALARSRRTADR